MREIKFRVWDHAIEDWADDTFESDVDEETIATTPVQYLVNTMYHKNKGLQFTFQLSTGLMDKEGREIFEGDVINVPYNRIGNVKVEFGRGSFNICDYDISQCEIIGNIYENPELL